MSNNNILASDNFASGSLAAGWSASFGVSECQVIGSGPSAVTEPNALSTAAGQNWTALGALTNQISEVTVQALTANENSYINLQVRWQPGSKSGYDAEFAGFAGVSGVKLFRWDNGVATQLGSTVNVTIAAGDVISLCADGASLAVYKNGTRLIWEPDTTYTTGYPGYVQYSSVDVTHTQISAWRGYSLVQQNGIWQKQGCIIPSIASDIATSGRGTFNNSQIFSGPAQLLSGTVFKMLLSGGANIYYAESSDGKSWARDSSAAITGYVNPSVIEVAGTYYCYCQPNLAGTSDFALFTASDLRGRPWTSVSTTVLGLGTAGQWDANQIYFFLPVAVISGTWYALYLGNSTSGAASKIGLATSSDGQTWTKYASNPVYAASVGMSVNGIASITGPINGYYYLFAQGSDSSQNNNTNPTDTLLLRSTDLINWSQVYSPFLWHSQLSEGVNTTGSGSGQCIPNSIVDIGGKAYLYTTSSAADAGSAGQYQISLAIAPTTIANIVAQIQDGTLQNGADAFARSAGGLGANWQTLSGTQAPQIASSGIVEANSLSTSAGAAYIGTTPAADQYSEVTIGALASGCFINPVVRASLSAATWYEADITGPTGTLNTTTRVYRKIAGTATAIGPALTYTPRAGSKIRLSVQTGSDGYPVLSLFQDGFLLWQYEDVSSSAIASGTYGFLIYAVTSIANAQMSAWSGGNANVIPVYSNIQNCRGFPIESDGTLLNAPLNGGYQGKFRYNADGSIATSSVNVDGTRRSSGLLVNSDGSLIVSTTKNASAFESIFGFLQNPDGSIVVSTSKDANAFLNSSGLLVNPDLTLVVKNTT